MDFDTMMPHVLACGQEIKQQLAGNLQLAGEKKP